MSMSGNMKTSLLLLLLLFTLGFLTKTTSSCLAAERDALLEFRAGMNGTLKRMPSWEEEDCCNWEGVVCHPTTRHVVKLKLSECIQDFKGQVHQMINSSLLALTELNHLDLSYNHFYNVPIPKFIGSFKKLKYLNLSNSFFTGGIPLEFRNLTRLRSLDLDNALDPEQQHVGDLDWLTHLSSLKHLDISGLLLTNLTDWLLPSNLQGSLNALITRGCNLNSIPVSPSNVNFTSLEILDISDNHFNTTLPQWFWNITSLTHLDLGNSGIYGTIPEAIGASTSLTYLDLSNNYIEGTIPRSITHLLRLESLRLHGNQFEGQLDDLFSYNYSSTEVQFPSWSNIVEFSLSNNKLEGGIPLFVCNWTGLNFLYLSHNSLTGEIPPCLGESLKGLVRLDLANNNLFGKIPTTFGSMLLLAQLVLNNNDFSGQLPPSLQNCTGLSYLDLAHNAFSGSLPSWMGERLQRLQLLHLGYNIFSGDIPLQLTQLEELKILDLSNNNFSGSLPYYLGNFTTMASTSPDQYKFTVNADLVIPTKGGNLHCPSKSDLFTSLDFSGNKLTGEIPPGVGHLKGLHNLNLSRNHLSGKIPQEIGEMTSLESLDLSFNELSDTIPDSLADLNFLSYINLSYNNLMGRIPSGPQLQTLNDASRYMGNPGLCGPPVSSGCSVAEAVHEVQNMRNFEWIYIAMVLGFMMGFWTFWGLLFFKREWRHAYFRGIDSWYDRI